MFLFKLASFLKKDAKIFVSYKLSFLMTCIGMVVSVATFYYIAKLFGKSASTYLPSYNTDYFSFVLIGIAFSTYLTTSLSTFANHIREAQASGVLESMLVTPSSVAEIMIGMSIWDFVFTSFRIIIYLIIGIFFFGMQFNNPDILAGILILMLSVVCFSFIGIMSAGFILIFKRSEPVGWFIGGLTGLFSGVFFPIEVLPLKLQVISYFLPATYSLRALRHALLSGYSFKMLMPDISVLIVFSIVLLPLAVIIFKYTLKQVKIDGSLVHY
ncbi:MAG: ABC transporter [Candidatus Omnitrophica bacterium CG11_big_fil_rev_8_21_14_0_20_42_13]|uniref:Transport permease protein n=1 Tax=Candidatus Ghiorseimicrobium undicola TaxID=1974746 RepID=A0A2H0M019_9BACT|nr:MAG: ABC transporter [Candidatus Omnitrophica bacterium CG11_big_fil_rev_8_21_14_0_20_42_13]